MTFSMMWIQGDAVLGVADSVETRFGVAGRSGTTALGQTEHYPDQTVSEAVMKLSMLGGRVLVAMAGARDAAIASLEELEAEIEGGASGPDALERIASRARTKLEVELLVGAIVDGRPVLSEWTGCGRPVHHRERVARIVGSMDPVMRSDLARAACDAPDQMDPTLAITALQAAVHLAMALEPGMLRRGIGGALCGAVLDEKGMRYQAKTLWIIADETFFDAMIEGTKGAGDALGFIFSSVADNRHFVCSSYYEQQFSESVFLAAPSQLTDEQAHAWADAQRAIFYAPEVVVFVSLRRKAVVVVPHANALGSPVFLTRDPFRLGIDQTAVPIFRKRLSEGRALGIPITFHQWWQR